MESEIQHADEDEIQEQIIIELDGSGSKITSTMDTRAAACGIFPCESIHESERQSAEKTERREPPHSEPEVCGTPEEPNCHLELLFNLEPVTSVHNLKGLRQLFDAVESNVRAPGVSASLYGGLMSLIIMSRLPELRLIVSRELSEDEWDVEVVMEIDHLERLKLGNVQLEPHHLRKRSLLSNFHLWHCPPSCVYCSQAHSSGTYQMVSDPEGRKQILQSNGRCFNAITSARTVGRRDTVPSGVEGLSQVYVRQQLLEP